MPPNDHALIAWFQRQSGVQDVQVKRRIGSLTVGIEKRELWPTFQSFSPPLAELGYRNVEGTRFSWTSRPFPPFAATIRFFSDHYWLVAAVALSGAAVVFQWARRQLRPAPLHRAGN
jgi:hypothetical protein